MGKGSAFVVGTEDEPFLHQALITLHGSPVSKEIPLYGAKVLACRECTLDLHGRPHLDGRVHTKLAATAAAGGPVEGETIPYEDETGEFGSEASQAAAAAAALAEAPAEAPAAASPAAAATTTAARSAAAAATAATAAAAASAVESASASAAAPAAAAVASVSAVSAASSSSS